MSRLESNFSNAVFVAVKGGKIYPNKIVHKEAIVQSEQPIEFKSVRNDPSFDTSILGEGIIFNYNGDFSALGVQITPTTDYGDYWSTNLVYEITSSAANQSIEITIPYANVLSNIDAKYAVVCQWSPRLNKWVALPTTVDKDNKTISSQALQVGIFCVFINHYWYSEYTQSLADEFPDWAHIKRNKNSNGQRFLNFFGIELEEFKEHLEWIENQKYINRADTTVLDWIYLYEAIPLRSEQKVLVLEKTDSGYREVSILPTLRSFVFNDTYDGVMIDFEKGRFYSVYDYDELYYQIDNGPINQCNKRPFHLWNTFDEFGLLLGVKRLFLEKNVDFKERILDVFRYPANSSDEGLTNGIARELGMIDRQYTNSSGQIIKLEWINDYKSFVIKNSSGLYIDPNSVRVDGKRLDPTQFTIDHNNNVIIYPLEKNQKHQVSIIRGIEKFELHNKDDEKLYALMYQDDGQATSKLLNWVKYINTVAPVMWDHFRWDEGFWDTIDKDLTGLGYVPNTWDSNIDVWKGVTVDDIKA